ncbi:hypothetical protein L1987_84293 [Smallanthus sonchifolius]|uniref:Uncharacterized protein n=1 Tax=Smallanthus sonchifolius TaxID=185202 RepID=A0ACB8YEY4_9ASTR|nr:hypothetical protein L1987_84293 [Smallanthus sonchifolius]
MGDWKKAEEFFNKDKNALIDKLDVYGNTALHIAIGDPGNIMFVENLLEQINPKSLPSLVNDRQQNALHFAAILDNTIAAKKLVDKNPHLLFTVDNMKYLPIERAIYNSHKTTFVYLLQVCKQHIGLIQKEECYNPFDGERGVKLLDCTILAGFLGVAYDLLQDYPELARTKVPKPPLWCIAKKWDAYPSAKRYNFYQRFVYSHVPIENCGDVDHTCKIQDIENQETNTVGGTKKYIYQVPHIKHLQEDRVKHTITLMILKFICEEVARYAEEDFLYKLPKRLILGLVMLFMSVTTMMIAFSATLYIMFGQEKSWIMIPIATLTCLPIASFVTLQLPLLVDLISSTYGPGIFGKRSELRITS